MIKHAGMAIVLLCTLIPYGYGAFQRDYVKETQTDPVAVTEELLTRESESGPASPSFKMKDTSTFMGEKPYGNQKKEEFLDETSDSETDFSTENWDDWFHSEKEEVKSTEALVQKEVKEKT